MSGISCFNQFFVTNHSFQRSWSDDASVSCRSESGEWTDPSAGCAPTKPDPIQADQTTYNSGKKNSTEANDRRLNSPMYSLAEDVLIYTKVSAAKNKLSAKKMVAHQLGRTYSGIMNRYQILKSLSPQELEHLLEKAREVEGTADPGSVSAVIKKMMCPETGRTVWRLSHYLANGFKIVDPRLEATDPQPDSPLASPTVRTQDVLIGDRCKKVRKDESKTSQGQRKKRGPYKTKHLRELERVRGAGSDEHSQFLKALLEAGLEGRHFSCEEVLENVFEKHHHSHRMIEMVLEAGQSFNQLA